MCTSLEAQTLLPPEVHLPSPLPHLGGRSWGNGGIPGGHRGRELCLSWCGTSPATPHWPSMKRGKNKSTGKEGRQVLLSGSLVSMATGSALLQLLTPQSLCHPIFIWEIKEKGKVVEVWGGEILEIFLGFAERRLIRMQPCLAFNHKLNPLCGGFLWDSSDSMHCQIPCLPPSWSSMQERQPSHALLRMRSS